MRKLLDIFIGPPPALHSTGADGEGNSSEVALPRQPERINIALRSSCACREGRGKGPHTITSPALLQVDDLKPKWEAERGGNDVKKLFLALPSLPASQSVRSTGWLESVSCGWRSLFHCQGEVIQRIKNKQCFSKLKVLEGVQRECSCQPPSPGQVLDISVPHTDLS
jgi:hypothetical protein